jgi:hypothetical protein
VAPFGGPFGFRGDRRKAFEPTAQVVGENERSSGVLHGSKFTRTDRLIEAGAPNARNLTPDLTTVGRDCPGNHVLVFARTLAFVTGAEFSLAGDFFPVSSQGTTLAAFEPRSSPLTPFHPYTAPQAEL